MNRTGVGKNLTEKLTLPLAAVGAVGVKSFAEVDKTMQLTNQTMGNSEEQAELLNKAMKEAASNSTFGISDLDMENRIIDINKQLQRTSTMEYIIEPTKTNAGTRKLPMTEEVFRCFQAILEDREPPAVEPMVDGHVGFLYLDDQGLPLVAMHWEHRFNRMVRRYNDIFRVQMPNITPHVCRHTYCSNQARAGMNPKTLQYLMGHSDISVTMNVYTHLGLEDAAAEMARMKVVEEVRQEQEKVSGKTRSSEMTQKMFRVI